MNPTEGDAERRVEFANWCLLRVDTDQHFITRIIFTDEAIFYLNGHVNRHNTRLWAQENPHWYAGTKCQDAERVMVFGGIWGDRVIGPYFFEDTVNRFSFTEMMDTQVNLIKKTMAPRR